MPQANFRAVTLFVAVTALAGCVHPTGGRSPICLPCRVGYVAPEANLLERGVLSADALALPDDAASLAGVGRSEGMWRLLSPEECQCVAVERAPTAHLVDIERRLAIASTPARQESRMARGLQVHQRLLALRALQIRNEAAGAALEAYYQLAGAEASIDVLDRSLAHVRGTLAEVQQLQQRGLQTPVDESELRRQEWEILSRRAELEWTVAQLNGKLRLALGWDLDGLVRIWPDVELLVDREPVDAHAAAQTALATRADLATLRLLSRTLDEATLPLVRGALQTQDATLGNVTSGFERLGQLLRPARGDDEMQARRVQLSALLMEKERELIVAIHVSAGAVEMRRDQALLAKLALESSRQRLRDLRQMRDVGQVTPFQVAAHESQVLEAEALLVQRVVEWRVAQVKLRQAQGVLAPECVGSPLACGPEDLP